MPHIDALPPARVRDAARRHLAGTPDAAGAAVVAAVAAAVSGPAVHRAFADRGHADHGIGFAARAMVELTRLTAAPAEDGPGIVVVRHEGVWPEDDPDGVLRHVRRLLARASDDDYDDAVRRLARHRTTAATRGVTAYLAPTRRDWVEEAVEESAGLPWLRRLARLSLADAARLDRPDLLPRPGYARDEFVTLADGTGPDLLAFLLRCLDRPGAAARDRALVLDTVAALPSDEAFGALLGLVEGKGVRAQVRREARRVLPAAEARFPVRAVPAARPPRGARTPAAPAKITRRRTRSWSRRRCAPARRRPRGRRAAARDRRAGRAAGRPAPAAVGPPGQTGREGAGTARDPRNFMGGRRTRRVGRRGGPHGAPPG
ncbi:hypothetical protein, partial [Actinomadura sp. CNU-125]|uniref:hypothetical protein n=1 Tax=Actinomadura sp. CNU-125 TaxID=1904961 RepID=UPI0021CCFD64